MEAIRHSTGEVVQAERRERFVRTLIAHRNRPPGNDRYIGAFAASELQDLQSCSPESERIIGVVDHRTDLNPEMIPNLLLRAEMMQLQRLCPDTFPADFDTPDRWSDGRRMISDDPVALDEFTMVTEALKLKVASNKPQRYATVKLAWAMYAERFTDFPSVLDVGSSQNLGLKKLATHYNMAMPFDAIAAVRPQQRSEDEAAATDVVYDGAFTSEVNKVLSAKFYLKESYGIDLFGPKDELFIKWARACSFYPSEQIHNRSEIATYDKLAAMHPDEVKFRFYDFSIPEPNPDLLPSHTTDAGFDIVYFSTIMSQLTPEQRESMLSNALHYAGKRPGREGLIIVQDTVAVDPEHPDQLQFSDDIYGPPYSYRALVLDTRHPEKGFQEFVKWETPRCLRIQRGLGFAALQRMSRVRK